ncbi:hypothetical protein FOA52_003151 [Chlamydomonas sp. UWO 241]|nr:hypothetical protein FOA52_003151 [Chlamydomonas sp. UWO 241]
MDSTVFATAHHCVPDSCCCCCCCCCCRRVLVTEQQVAVDPRNFEGWTPLCCAVSRGHVSVVKFLLKNKANAHWTGPHGQTLMHVASWYSQEIMVRWLTQHGVEAATTTVHGARPLDVTRPGATRRSVFSVMASERMGGVGGGVPDPGHSVRQSGY